MYFIVIFESLNYQSHLVTKYNFVSKYYYIIKGIMCFLSLYQLDINKNTILSIFLYIEEEFSCIKKTNSKLSLDGSGNLKTQKIPKSTV